jgi:hypothetical protein
MRQKSHHSVTLKLNVNTAASPRLYNAAYTSIVVLYSKLTTQPSMRFVGKVKGPKNKSCQASKERSPDVLSVLLSSLSRTVDLVGNIVKLQRFENLFLLFYIWKLSPGSGFRELYRSARRHRESPDSVYFHLFYPFQSYVLTTHIKPRSPHPFQIGVMWPTRNWQRPGRNLQNRN